MPELVLIVPRAQLFSSGEFYGLRHEGLADHLHLIEMHAFFALRDQVEDNPSLKQIIPYVVLRHQDRLFLTHRTRQGTPGYTRSIPSGSAATSTPAMAARRPTVSPPAWNGNWPRK